MVRSRPPFVFRRRRRRRGPGPRDRGVPVIATWVRGSHRGHVPVSPEVVAADGRGTRAAGVSFVPHSRSRFTFFVARGRGRCWYLVIRPALTRLRCLCHRCFLPLPSTVTVSLTVTVSTYPLASQRVEDWPFLVTDRLSLLHHREDGVAREARGVWLGPWRRGEPPATASTAVFAVFVRAQRDG